MKLWLVVVGVVQVGAPTAAYAETHILLQDRARPIARSADFSLHAGSWANDPGPLDGGMIKKEDAATDTLVGLGLVKMRGRKRDGSDMQPGADMHVQKRNPAVTVVLKF